MVGFTPLPFLLVYLCVNVGLWGLLAVALPALFHNLPPPWVHQLPPCCESSLPQLPVSAPPTSVDECYFFISLVVGLPCSSIFCQFWLFLFLNCCCPSFGCARRHSVSTYTSILAGTPILSFMCFALGDILVKILLHGNSEIFLLMFFSGTFTLL